MNNRYGSKNHRIQAPHYRGSNHNRDATVQSNDARLVTCSAVNDLVVRIPNDLCKNTQNRFQNPKSKITQSVSRFGTGNSQNHRHNYPVSSDLHSTQVDNNFVYNTSTQKEKFLSYVNQSNSRNFSVNEPSTFVQNSSRNSYVNSSRPNRPRASLARSRINQRGTNFNVNRFQTDMPSDNNQQKTFAAFRGNNRVSNSVRFSHPTRRPHGSRFSQPNSHNEISHINYNDSYSNTRLNYTNVQNSFPGGLQQPSMIPSSWTAYAEEASLLKHKKYRNVRGSYNRPSDRTDHTALNRENDNGSNVLNEEYDNKNQHVSSTESKENIDNGIDADIDQYTLRIDEEDELTSSSEQFNTSSSEECETISTSHTENDNASVEKGFKNQLPITETETDQLQSMTISDNPTEPGNVEILEQNSNVVLDNILKSDKEDVSHDKDEITNINIDQ